MEVLFFALPLRADFYLEFFPGTDPGAHLAVMPTPSAWTTLGLFFIGVPPRQSTRA